ncbi:MAG TPA: DUF305 domain-containing protein [Nakamurella sp.]
MAEDSTPTAASAAPGEVIRPDRSRETTGEAVPARPGHASAASRVLLLSAAALVLLLVGATLGLALSGAFRSAPATPDSSSVDAGFARDMIVHHDQGVLMAHYAEHNTTDPEIDVMAYDIGYAQTAQIGQMQGWLSLWDLPESTDAPRMSWMSGGVHGGHDLAVTTTGATSAGQTPLMPGMATDSEMARLRALRGAESDVYFLQLMTRHHQGGTSMMVYAAEHATNPVVRNFAQKMADAQSAEVSVMTQMLAERGAQPLPTS